MSELDLSTAEKSRSYLASCKSKHQYKNGIAFVTKASAEKMGLTKDAAWDGTVRGFKIKNKSFHLAKELIDGNPVMICEDAENRLGVFYSILEDMTQLYV